jgi:hypothetical protein
MQRYHNQDGIGRGGILSGASAIFLVAAGLYSLTWILVMPKWYRYCINPDGVSYISIAQKYLRGDFADAINGYWGPLYSWLLTPLLLIGIEPLLAARLLGGGLGLGAFAGLSLLARHFGLSRQARRAVALAAWPVVLFYSVFGVMPDLLLAVILLFYLYSVFRLDHNRAAYGLAAGGTGAAAYLAKSYALPFFVAHLLLMTVCQFLRAGGSPARRTVLRNACCALLVFSLIAGTWVGLLSAKCGKFTWSTSGRYNLGRLAPPGAQNHLPRIAPPPNETAISAWEDPSCLGTAEWSPLHSLGDFAYYAWRIVQNAHEILMALLEFSSLSGAILVLIVLLLLDRDTLRTAPDKTLYPLVTLVLFCAGYMLVLIETRYLWFCCFLLLLMGGYAYDRVVVRNPFFTRVRRGCVVAAFIASFAVAPIFQLVWFRNMGRESRVLAQALGKYIQPGDRIASDGESRTSLFLAYHLKARCYTGLGMRPCDGDAAAIEADLGRYGIDHYLVWEKARAGALSLAAYQKISTSRSGLPVLYTKKHMASSPQPILTEGPSSSPRPSTVESGASDEGGRPAIPARPPD